MLKTFTKRIVWSWMILCFVSLRALPAQNETNTDKKLELIVVHIEVTDRKTRTAIDNADVQVKWGQRESDAGFATTNSKGVARLVDVPRGMAVIRVIASGYDVAAPKIDLKTEEQPIKIELDKETHGHNGDTGAPPTE